MRTIRPDARLGMRRPGRRQAPRFWSPYVGPILIRLRYESIVRDILKETA